MADSLPSAAPRPFVTPGTPYITITDGLRGFYAARGMWANGQPQGALAAMLGARTPWKSATGDSFFVSSAQLEELKRDLIENGPRGLNPWQISQSLRRFREAAVRSGAPAGAGRGIERQAASSAVRAMPFEPLKCPASGKAKQSFEDHVMRTIRDFIDYSQSSAYMQQPGGEVSNG